MKSEAVNPPLLEAFRVRLRLKLRRYLIRLSLVAGGLLFLIVFLAPDIFKVIPAVWACCTGRSSAVPRPSLS
jgi:hypothetical protein